MPEPKSVSSFVRSSFVRSAFVRSLFVRSFVRSLVRSLTVRSFVHCSFSGSVGSQLSEVRGRSEVITVTRSPQVHRQSTSHQSRVLVAVWSAKSVTVDCLLCCVVLSK